MSGRVEEVPSPKGEVVEIGSLNSDAQNESDPQISPKLSEEAEKARENYPNEVDEAECERLKNLGNSFFNQGKIEEALAEYRRALLKAPIKDPSSPPTEAALPQDNAVRFSNEANTTSHAPDVEEVAPPSQTLESIDGRMEKVDECKFNYILTSQVLCNTGYCLMKQGVRDEAIKMLSESIRHNPKYAKAFLRRADTYYDLEKWSNAYGDYESYEKLAGVLSADGRARKAAAKVKVDEEMGKMLSDLKDLGNRFLGNFGLSTDNFKFDKDPKTGGYSMRFER